MSKPTVAVYGNLLHDTLVYTNGWPNDAIARDNINTIKIVTRGGGIMNFCRAAADLDNYVTVATADVGDDYHSTNLSAEFFQLDSNRVKRRLATTKLPTSQAVVICDLQNCRRIGLPVWGACRQRRDWSPADAGWHHLMYLDRLDHLNLKDFRARIGPDAVMSADVCDSTALIGRRADLANLDYLIVAEVVAKSLQDVCLPVRRAVIVHRPAGSYVCNSGGYVVADYTATTTGWLNVVGAGDYFAACCIANLLIDGCSPSDLCLAAVHHATTRLLRAQS